MSCRTFFLLPALFIVAFSLGQTTTSKWVPLPMDAPTGLLNSIPIGPKASGNVLHMSINMPYRDPVGMQAFVDSVSNPKSPSYRHFISPAEVGARFGQTTTNVAKVTAYLAAQGMKVRLVSQNHLSILADATVAQAETAFNTTIENFATLASTSRFSFTTAPSLPASIAGLVSYVGGLDNYVQGKRHSGPLTPSQLETLYGVASMYGAGNQGQGRTVAISNFDGYSLTNVPLEYTQFSLPAPSAGVGTNITVVPIDGRDGGTYGTVDGEGDIDMQCVLAMAPLCNLIIYDDASDTPGDTSDPVSVLTQEAEDNLADVISESWGWSGTSDFYAACHAQHLSMTAQGITYMAAVGDLGTGELTSFPYPDMEPEVLIVGGTSVDTDANGNRTSEVTWSNNDGAGAGGWVVSTDPFNVLPSWQKGFGVPTNIPYRLSPDISFSADPENGYEIFSQGGFFEYGGTSCASPTCAGDLADSEQAIIAGGGLGASPLGKQRLGRIQDLLYSYNPTSVNTSIFFDITSGASNGTLPNGAASNAGPGWDTATGWGPLVFSGFVSAILNLTIPKTLTISPTSVLGGGSATATVTISAAAPAGGFSLAVASNAAAATVPSSVTVASGETTASFPITTVAVSNAVPATISAYANDSYALGVLTVNPPAVSSLSVSPTSVTGGATSTGTVTIASVNSVGTETVTLSSSSASAAPPATVAITSGSTSATFTINTTGVGTSTPVTISAAAGGVAKTAVLTIIPPVLLSFTVTPSSVTGGTSSRGLATLNGPAGTGGAVVKFSSNSPSAAPPSQNTISAGGTSASFNISTLAVSSSTTATITATYQASSVNATLTVLPPVVSAFTITPSTVTGGTSSRGNATLSGPAPTGGLVVKFTSSSTSAVPPTQNTIPAGGTSANFNISTLTVTNQVVATITASCSGSSKTALLTVNPSIVLASFTVTPSSVVGGTSSRGLATLNEFAPTGGQVVKFSSNNSNAIPPSQNTIPAGGSSASFSITTQVVTATTTATITATCNGSSLSAALTITPANQGPTIVSFTITPSTVTGGTSARGAVTISGPAPAGGLVIKLSSNNSNAIPPSQNTIPAGGTAANFSIGTLQVSATVTATITASTNGSSMNATLTISP